MNLKKPKLLKDQISYLKDEKNIYFDRIDEEEAKDLLLRFNYINIITPFKFYYFIKDNKGFPIKDSLGKHQYPKKTDFSQYFDRYKKERSTYPVIFKNIYEIESNLKSQISYIFLNKYDTSSKDGIIDFIDMLKLNIIANSVPIERKIHMIDDFDEVYSELEISTNHFVSLDKLSLRKISNIFHCITFDDQKLIFSNLKKNNLNLGVNDIEQFKERLFKLVSIRNYVMHCRSLTILCRFYSENSKNLRTDTDRKKYERLIQHLEQNNEKES